MTKSERIQLLVTSECEGEILLNMLWTDGRLTVISCSKDIVESVNQWTKYGLDEFVGPDGHEMPRNTISTDRSFLERLRDYLDRQFSFTTELIVLRRQLASPVNPKDTKPGTDAKTDTKT